MGGPNTIMPIADRFLEGASERSAVKPRPPYRIAFAALVSFYFVYLYRPEDWVPILAHAPLAKIAGSVASIAILGILLIKPAAWKILPRFSKLVILLFVDLMLCVPFAYWRGGSFDIVFDTFSKVVAISVAAGLVINSLGRLKLLLAMQALQAPIFAMVAIHLYHGGRLEGVTTLFDNPNDFALLMAMSAPLCVGVIVGARNWPLRVSALGALCLDAYTIQLTSSRGGYVAFLAAMTICVWKFGIRQKRKFIIAIALSIMLLPLIMGPSAYMTRMFTIFSPDSDESGSAQARRELLIRSIEITAQHPVFGVGPGNFEELSGAWHVAHNTYTQVSAEAGLPGFFIFIMVLVSAVRGLVKLEKKGDDYVVLAPALLASVVALLVGCFFASLSYFLLTYMVLSNAAALTQIAAMERLVTSDKIDAERTEGWKDDRVTQRHAAHGSERGNQI
jgi:O-antigen ligase